MWNLFLLTRFSTCQNLVKYKQITLKQVELIGELLKTLFNLTVKTEIESDLSRDLVILLRDHLLWEFENKDDNNNELNNHIINLLINVPETELGHLMLECVTEPPTNETLQYMGYDMTAIYTMLECLKAKFTKNCTVSKQLELLSPVITVLRNCARSCRRMRKYLKTQVLPPLKDVRSRPEEEESYRGYFCRLLTSPITEVRDLSADFLFILCKENVNRMIKYTGYGNAAGMFASRGLMLGGNTENSNNYSSDSSDSDTDEYNQLKSQINPVMGCYQPDTPKATDNMTDEQKEYEAMKLVNLMDNLTKTGIVQPCTVGPDGKPKPIKHVLQLQQGLKAQQIKSEDNDSD
nr:synembryn [Onthophagus taurus]